MKAILHPKYGPPSVLQIKEIEKPVPKDDEVLVKVFAATVNRTDCATLRAKPFIMRFVSGFFKPKKPTLGTDFAGEIEVVGKAVTSFKVGDKVFGFNDLGVCSHAQFLSISKEKEFATIPDNINFEEAAASIEGAHYAYNMLNKVEIKKGQKVLVNGATGAIGSAAVQLLKYFEVEVDAVCQGKDAALVQSIGATRTFDYTKEDFTKTDGKYDYVFDTVGKSSFGKCKPLLKRGGVYISSELGWLAQNIFFALFTPLFSNKKVIFPIPKNPIESVELVKKLMAQGDFKPVIDRKYPLEQIVEAFNYVEKGQKIGNVIITMEDKV